jgi:hypothetical protein
MNRQVRNLLFLAVVIMIGVSFCIIGCEKKDDTVKCDKCGLTKGSPECCKITKDAATATICTKCGQIAGSDLCCKPGDVKCDKCGLAKGSPGCCKLPKM